MTTNLSTYPCVGNGLLDTEQTKNLWRSDFEKELREKAIRLLQCRAGGRFTLFEAGMLYQICLDIGMPDSRDGKYGEQEDYWDKVILSCMTEGEAKETLANLLHQERAKSRRERYEERLKENALIEV